MSQSEAPNFMECGEGNCTIFAFKISKNMKYPVTFSFGIVALINRLERVCSVFN